MHNITILEQHEEKTWMLPTQDDPMHYNKVTCSCELFSFVYMYIHI